MNKFLFILLFFSCFSLAKAQVWKEYTNNDGLTSNYVRCLTHDNAGNLWIGTMTGLNQFDGTTFTGYTMSNGLPNNTIKSLCFDSNNNLWIGTQGGLSKKTGTGFTNYTTANGLLSNNITALTSNAGILWIGTASAGLSKFNGTNFTNYTTTDGLVSNAIITLCFDLTGNLWIGTIAGISVFNGTNFTNYTMSNGLPSNNIKNIICDASNNIWIGTTAGLVKYNGSAFTIFNSTNGLLGNTIPSLVLANDGNIWCGYLNDKGISKFDGSLFTHYTPDNGFLWSNIYCLHAWNNDIYAGTSVGLLKFKQNIIPPVRCAWLDTNNIKAIINASGVLFEETDHSPGFFCPKNTQNTSVYSSGIWFGGFDQSNLLHVAAQGYLFEYNDFNTGPMFEDLSTYNSDSSWNRVWKISKTDVDYHIANYNQPGYVMPQSILTWPGSKADYVDVNNNHIYDPQNGDYPLIRGDQAILAIFNEMNNNHYSDGLPLGIEVHALAYSFNSNDSALANTVFVNYKFYNYSANNYHDFYVAIFNDLDVGNPYDDYIGCDSTLNLFFEYNATDSDYEYGTHIPAQGVAFLSSPMSSFNYINGFNPSVIGQLPVTDIEFYRVLSGYWVDGTPYTYGGNGYGGTTPTNFCFSGDPNDPNGWSEITANNPLGERETYGKVGPFDLLAGKALCLDIAFINAISYSGDNLNSVPLLKERTSQIKNFYNNQNWDCGRIYVDSATSPHLYTSDHTMCKNQSFQATNIIVGGNPPYTCSWSPVTGVSDPAILNPTITTAQTTVYTITVTDSYGNTASENLTVFISVPTINAGNDTILCNNQSLVLNALPTGYTAYSWSSGQATSSITVNTNHNLSGVVPFIVTAYDYNGCTNRDTVMVNFLPAPNVLFGNDTILCNVSTLLLDAGTADHYLWSNGSTSQTILVDGTVLPLGVYNYSVHTWNDNGCESYDTIHVQVDECNVINDLPASGIKIYPNPGDGTFYIKTTQPCEIKVLNELGKAILTKQISPDDNKIVLKNATKGVYMIEIKTDKKTYKSKLIIK